MRAPYGLELNESCRTCKVRCAGFFCSLQTETLSDFDRIASPSTYPDGAVLFLEKQTARGVYLLCHGEVKLSISSSEGKTMILRIAKPGEILGLQAVLSGKLYEATAETLNPCQIVFIYRDEFLRFIAEHTDAHQNTLQHLASQYQSTCEQLRTVGLTSSPHERLAKLLLDWCAGGQQTKSGTRINMRLTHEEIAELIGVTRETVSRTLGEFRDQQLVAIQGASWMIPNRAALESFVSI